MGFDGVFKAQNGVEKVVVSLLQMTRRGCRLPYYTSLQDRVLEFKQIDTII